MSPRFLLAVLLLFAGASCADAGVIVDRSVDDAAYSSSESLNAVSDWIASQDSEELPPSWEWGHEGSLAGTALASVQAGGAHALVSSEMLWMATPALHWQVALANSTLPVSPLLDGLLKPS